MQYGKYKRYPKERKTIDLGTFTLTAAVNGTVAGGSMQLLNGIAQGSDYNQRIGRRINIRSILIRMFISNGSTPASQPVRIILFHDAQTNGVDPTANDLLGSASAGGSSTTAVNNLSNRDRFRIMMDKIILLQTNGGTTSGTADRKYLMKYKKCNLLTTYGGTGATVGAIISGAIYLLAVSQFTLPSTNAPTIITETRIRFLDD